MTQRDIEQTVPRETIERLHEFQSLLMKWQASINLISGRSEEIWQRHIYDSLQLLPVLKQYSADRAVHTHIDIGSGGGLPGLVLAIADETTPRVLIESDRRKAIFLQEAVRHFGLHNCKIMNERVENVDQQASIITARALASLTKLFEISSTIRSKDTICCFLKGRNWDKEVEEAKKSWQFTCETYPSVTDQEARIVVASQIERKKGCQE